MTFGERLKKVRLESGMTQKEVAEKCGIADSNYRAYELDKVQPKFDTALAIADALGVPRMYFVEYVFDREIQSGPKHDEDTPFYTCLAQNISRRLGLESKLVLAFAKLNHTGREKAVERVEELAKIPDYQRKDDDE